jgi:glycosyltransferase involved in cell wall biosynthesis
MRKKNIAIIGESYIGTGKGLYPVELFKALTKISKKYNFKLYLRYTAPFDAPNVVKVTTFGAKMRVLSGLGYYLPLFYKLRKDKSIDLIHAYDVKTNIVSLLLRKPTVVTEYDVYPLYYAFPFNYVFRALYGLLGKANSIISVSDYLKNLLIRECPRLSKKIDTVHLGVDTERFKPSKRDREEKPVTIGILGNLDDVEGGFGDVDGKLWNVFEKIAKEYGENVRIIIGGKDIPAGFDRLKVYPQVEFKGFIKESDLVKYYQEIDIFIYKYNQYTYQHKVVEATATFELIPLEAMACGCAVVASKKGALLEVVGNGGVLIENSEKNFYKSIKELIDNKKLRENIQKKGRAKSKTLTWNKCAKEHLKIYDKITNGK